MDDFSICDGQTQVLILSEYRPPTSNPPTPNSVWQHLAISPLRSKRGEVASMACKAFLCPYPENSCPIKLDDCELINKHNRHIFTFTSHYSIFLLLMSPTLRSSPWWPQQIWQHIDRDHRTNDEIHESMFGETQFLFYIIYIHIA